MHSNISNKGLNFITFNIKGLNHPARRRKCLSFLKSKKCDIAMLQETHLKDPDYKRLCGGWVGPVYASCGTSNSRGVMILVNRHLQFHCIREMSDTSGRFIAIVAEVQGHTIIIASVYAPNVYNPNFFPEIENRLHELGDFPIILGCDANDVMDPILDRKPPPKRLLKTTNGLRDMCEGLGLVDIWRVHNPTINDFTFYSHPHNVFSRIDYFFLSHALVPSTTSCNIGSILLSDHAHVTLTIIPFIKSNRTPRWRLNSSLLQNASFKEYLRNEIKFFIETNSVSSPSAGILWETFKAFIRGHIIQHASFKKRITMAKQADLEKQIAAMEVEFKQDMSSNNLRKLAKLKYDYNSIMTQKAEFALFRARQKYFEEGEKAGRMLSRFIKIRESACIIPAITDGNGQLHYNTKAINDVFRSFYKNLYSSECKVGEGEVVSFLSGLNLPTISGEQCELLESPITAEEITQVITNLPNGKAPGLDGFTSEFYKAYVNELTPLLLDMYEESLGKGVLPPTLNESLITLILKKGKEATDCKSYRPISLLGQDQKILSKVLANRLEGVVCSVIHPDQVGFIRKRSFVDNTRRLIDIMWAAQSENSPMAAISLDAEKAFDRVEWLYLFKTLEAFGFGKKFISWIRLLYADPQAAVLSNGVISDRFSLHRGTAQGSPLSPLLFAIALEPLAEAIRQDPSFPGIELGQRSHKLMLYADDILLFVSQPDRSLPALLKLVDLFSKISGYKVNWGKSESLPLTSYCPKSLFRSGNFQWPNTGITYLGITFPPNLRNLVQVNFEPCLNRFKADIDRWAPLYLSLWGKVNIIKMNCVPKFHYLLQALPLNVPGGYFKQFDRLCRKFLWGEQRPKISLRTLQRPVDAGGLGLPNLLLYYYAFGLRHLAHWTLPPERAPPWLFIESSLFEKLPLIHIITSKLSQVTKTHPIIGHMCWIWKRTSSIFKLDPYLNASACLWLNHKLLIDKKPFYWSLWVDKGIMFIRDLYEGYTLKSFAILVEQYDLPQNQFYKYLQIRHMLNETILFPQQTLAGSNTLTKMLGAFGQGHEASRYYSSVLHNVGGQNNGLKQLWEADLGYHFTEEEWSAILKNVKKMSRELRTRLVQFKIVNRVYWTPTRLYKAKLKDDPSCWRCGETYGTLIHLVWSCPKAQDFWAGIHENIKLVVGQDIPFLPSLYVLGDPSSLTNIPKALASWVHTAIMLGRKIIVKEWKSDSLPLSSFWFTQLSTVAAYEELSYKLLNRLDLYHSKWGNYIDLVTKS